MRRNVCIVLQGSEERFVISWWVIQPSPVLGTGTPKRCLGPFWDLQACEWSLWHQVHRRLEPKWAAGKEYKCVYWVPSESGSF